MPRLRGLINHEKLIILIHDTAANGMSKSSIFSGNNSASRSATGLSFMIPFVGCGLNFMSLIGGNLLSSVAIAFWHYNQLRT